MEHIRLKYINSVYILIFMYHIFNLLRNNFIHCINKRLIKHKKSLDFSIKDDMLVTTFLVGILAIMDLISTLANLYHEFKESNENKIRKELDELKKRIEELENNNR